MTDICTMLPAVASAAKDVLLTATALVAAYVGLKGLAPGADNSKEMLSTHSPRTHSRAYMSYAAPLE